MSLNIQNLTLNLGKKTILNNVSLHVEDGERVGLVGSSGSGKSMLLRAATGLLPFETKISGSCMLGGVQTVGASDENLARLRGKYVGVVFQQANRALNPMLSVEEQISLPLRIHYQLDANDVHNRVCTMLEKVGLPQNIISKRTFELSGGQLQRVGIATALITSPRLILADEPTTALDSVTQKEVVNMLTSLVDNMGASMLFVTHDFSVLSKAAKRCYVLDSGRLVDSAEVQDLLENPRVTSTKQLVDAAKKLTLRAQKIDSQNVSCESATTENVSCENASRESASRESATTENVSRENSALLTAKNIHVTLGRALARAEVLKGVDLDLFKGESLAIIGGSGSGKTTLIRAMLGLQKISDGIVTYDSQIVNSSTNRKKISDYSALRKETSLVFQHPFAALDPRWTVLKSVAEPLNIWRKSLQLDDATICNRVEEMLQLVGLNPEDFLERYPHELSGGQAQCVCIARALINNPRVLLADEPMSAIDVAERTRILDAFAAIRKERPTMSCIFVSHDLGMIQHLATRVIVLNDGKIVESGRVSDVLNNSQNDYTRALVNAAIM
ncbi:ABC transporter ATP-binding protein [Gardnerella greenwoodii]|uniref:ABC transporter ATP-binding protein n=1 Tax=Gardnerella greenwoodii TaxID=2914925 RepID=A0A2N6RX91_9BIFI|nr:ABC transporter ATP-binding protein [Gardnerella greenwoodii]MDF0753723.1 ABC transporter ATP-binding protein [Gardnerella greenwoodii]PMC42729.1 ABC transporter ATP-binding protein [Gardnerella greenwoodii]